MRINSDTTFRELHEAGLISTRTINVIRCTNMDTIGEFVQYYEPDELLKFINFGKTSYTELKAICDSYKQQQAEAEQIKELKQLENLSHIEQGVINKAYELLTEQDKLPLKVYPTAASLHAAVCEPDGLSGFHQGLSVEENLHLRALCRSFIDQVEKDLLRLGKGESLLSGLYQSRGEALQNMGNSLPYAQIYKEYLSSYAYENFREFFDKQVQSLYDQKVSFSVMPILLHFYNVAELFDLPSSDYASHFSSMKCLSPKKLELIEQFVATVKQRLDTIVRKSDREIEMENLPLKYRFLTEADCQFIQGFYKQQGHLPLFYMLNQVVQKSYNLRTECYALRFGLRDGKCYTIAQLCERFSLSDSRIHQLLQQKDKIFDIISKEPDLVRYQSLLNSAYLTEDDPAIKQLIQQELLPTEWSRTARLLDLAKPLDLLEIGGKTFLYKNISGGQRVRDYMEKDFQELINVKRTSTEEYPIDSMVKWYVSLNKLDPEKVEECRDSFRELFRFIGQHIYGLPVNEQGHFVLKANFADVTKELLAILEKNGQPMNHKELLAAYNEKNPHYKLNSVGWMDEFLKDRSVVKPIGKTGYYGLTKWDHVYFGTIRDLITDTLTKAGKPISPEELLTEVHKFYPNVSLRDLKSTIKSDTLQRYRQLPSGRYTLAKEKKAATQKPRPKR